MSKISGSNMLMSDFQCPLCGTKVSCGIGFRAGYVANIQYKPGDKISWEGGNTWPESRPQNGTFATIGYFECENLKCDSWQDCFPEVQEVLISIENDAIVKIEPTKHKPDQISFDIVGLK